MRLGLAQLDSRVGDLAANASRIAAAVAELGEADLVVTPELALPGAPPSDLLLDPRFVRECEAALRDLARALRHGPPVLVGTLQAGSPGPHHPGLRDVAALLQGGEVRARRARRSLPTHDVHQAPRWFVPGPTEGPLEGWHVHLGDLPPEADLPRVCLEARPFGQPRAPQPRGPLVSVNAAGAQDELIFEGASFAVAADGRLLTRLPAFQEALALVDLQHPGPLAPEPELRGALVAGIRGFARKNGLGRAVLGLSGGIDSAVAACLAAEALGPERVLAVALPSRYSDPRSTESARELAGRLGLGFRVQELEPLHAAFEAACPVEGVAAENAQARLRMVLLMAEVNARGGFLLNTSNKTELALGYGTLYGDLAGALSPLGDLAKTEVCELARQFPQIPAFIRERPPSAELRPGQVDPFDYARVAPAVEAMLRDLPSGLPQAEEDELAGRIRASEHKRRQGPLVLKVSDRAFGTGRRMPVTCRARGGGASPRNENSASQS